MRRFVQGVAAMALVPMMLPVEIAGQTAGAPPPVTTPQGRAARPQPPADPDALTAAQVEQEFDNFALGQAQRQLGLAEAQYFRFARAYRGLQGVKRRAQRQRRVMMGELTAMLRPAGPLQDPDAVTARIAALDEHMVQSATAIRQAYVAVDGVLNVRQRARFRQFEQQMDRKKLELLALAQAGARGRGSPPR